MFRHHLSPLCGVVALSFATLSPAPTYAVPSDPTQSPSKAAAHAENYGGSGVPTIVSSIAPASGATLAIGTTTPIVLTLKTKSGKPVVAKDDLDVAHTERIHMLIVDPSLGDYHHLHPPAGTEPGTYVMNFMPKRAGVYHAFADLHPTATGIQEYSLSTFTVPGDRKPVEKLSARKVTVDGYTFELSFEDPNLVAGRGTGAKVLVTGPDGKPFSALEPIMGAYAHMVGFSEDLKHVAHIHPLGPEPTQNTERGGPELQFHVGINYPGYHVLYVQVQIGKRDVFAPFGVEVAPRKLPADAKGLMTEVDLAMDQLETVVHSGPMHKVHDKAFAVRDLLLALPERATELDEAGKTQLENSLKRVRSIAGLLDKYGDSNQATEAQAAFPKFQAELDTIHKLVGTTTTRGQVTNLGNTRCPISDAPVGSMQAGSSLVHNNIRVGLCCDGCAAAFNKDPEAGMAKARNSVAK